MTSVIHENPNIFNPHLYYYEKILNETAHNINYIVYWAMIRYN